MIPVLILGLVLLLMLIVIVTARTPSVIYVCLAIGAVAVPIIVGIVREKYAAKPAPNPKQKPRVETLCRQRVYKVSFPDKPPVSVSAAHIPAYTADDTPPYAESYSYSYSPAKYATPPKRKHPTERPAYSPAEYGYVAPEKPAQPAYSSAVSASRARAAGLAWPGRKAGDPYSNNIRNIFDAPATTPYTIFGGNDFKHEKRGENKVYYLDVAETGQCSIQQLPKPTDRGSHKSFYTQIIKIGKINNKMCIYSDNYIALRDLYRGMCDFVFGRNLTPLYKQLQDRDLLQKLEPVYYDKPNSRNSHSANTPGKITVYQFGKNVIKHPVSGIVSEHDRLAGHRSITITTNTPTNYEHGIRLHMAPEYKHSMYVYVTDIDCVAVCGLDLDDSVVECNINTRHAIASKGYNNPPEHEYANLNSNPVTSHNEMVKRIGKMCPVPEHWCPRVIACRNNIPGIAAILKNIIRFNIENVHVNCDPVANTPNNTKDHTIYRTLTPLCHQHLLAEMRNSLNTPPFSNPITHYNTPHTHSRLQESDPHPAFANTLAFLLLYKHRTYYNCTIPDSIINLVFKSHEFKNIINDAKLSHRRTSGNTEIQTYTDKYKFIKTRIMQYTRTRQFTPQYYTPAETHAFTADLFSVLDKYTSATHYNNPSMPFIHEFRAVFCKNNHTYRVFPEFTNMFDLHNIETYRFKSTSTIDEYTKHLLKHVGKTLYPAA